METQDHPLKKWRSLRNMKAGDVGERIGCSRQAVLRYEARTRVPTPIVIERIVVMTDGEVTANDWLGKEAADVVAKRQASA